MKVGDTVLLVGAAADCQYLIGRTGVIVHPSDYRGGSYFNVRVEGPHNHDRFKDQHTFLFKDSELRQFSALEQLAKAGERCPDANT